MDNAATVALILQRVHLHLVVDVEVDLVLTGLQAVRSQVVVRRLKGQVDLLVPGGVGSVGTGSPEDRILEGDLDERAHQRLAGDVLVDLDGLAGDGVLHDLHGVVAELVFADGQVIGVDYVDEDTHVLGAQVLAGELLALATHRVQGTLWLHVQVVEY